jgi:hypothetical protein
MRQFKLDKIKATGTTVGDLHFPNVKFLLPLNGTNGATTASDSGNDNRTVTFGGSNSNTSTAQSKFGGSSLSISGTDNSYIAVSSDGMNADGDFTFECWIYDTSTTDYPCLFSNLQSSSNALHTYVGGGSGNKVFRFWSQSSGTNFSTTLPTNQWYHLALVRNGSTIKLYIDGTADSTTVSNSSTLLFGGGSTLQLGYNSSSYRFNGYLDDVRFTKGLARYTSNFTPPTSAHLTQAGDVNKHIVVNSDADGVAIGTGGISQARVAKAWANIDASQAAASMIQASYNISSMTDHGTGTYSFNFSTAMTDADYSISALSGQVTDGTGSINAVQIQNLTTSLVKVTTKYYQASGGDTLIDYNTVCILIFGN